MQTACQTIGLMRRLCFYHKILNLSYNIYYGVFLYI